ncbi:MAG: hypothetical protein ACPLX8_01870, partial [Nanopusillaceae archaeon]
INNYFYFGVIPQTYFNGFPLYFIFYTDYEFDLFNKVELSPLYYLKMLIGDLSINLVISKSEKDIIGLNKDQYKEIIKDIFNPEDLIILSNPENILEKANTDYHKKFIKVYKS